MWSKRIDGSESGKDCLKKMKKIFQKYPVRMSLAFLCILSLAGFSFRNYYTSLPIHERNKKEISRIKVINPEDFSFAVFGDNKGNYSYFEPLLHEIDQDKKIAFAIDVGDSVSDGGMGQFRRFVNQVEENLGIPLLAAPGNHDFIYNPVYLFSPFLPSL